MRSALFLVLVAACGAEPIDVATLESPGPYAVGYRTYTIEYATPLESNTRSSFVAAWYPATSAEGERPFYTLRTSEVAAVDAPPADLGPLPVVVFSHGHQAYAAAMSHLMEHLASHGFLAIAPTHTGNTFVDGDNRTTEIYYLRTFDIRAALDFFQGLEDDPLAGLAADRVAVSGHSFGGYTAYALAGATYAIDTLEEECRAGTGPRSFCSTMTSSKADVFRGGLDDPRVSAVVSVDPGDFDLFGEGVREIDAPILHMAAEMSEDRYWPVLDGDVTRLFLKGGDHNDFTDACSTGLTIRCSDLPPESVWRPVRTVTLAFLRKHLLGEEGLDPILDGSTPVGATVAVEAR